MGHYTRAQGICDICGWRFPHDQLRKDWRGLMVCAKDWSPKPGDLSRPRIKPEGIPVRNPRPENYPRYNDWDFVFDFQNGLYRWRGIETTDVTQLGKYRPFTRIATYAEHPTTGARTYFAANAPRIIPDFGLYSERTIYNQIQDGHDLSGTGTATSFGGIHTGTLDQDDVDGNANSASKLTVDTNGAGVFWFNDVSNPETGTSGDLVHTFHCRLKRISGTGTVTIAIYSENGSGQPDAVLASQVCAVTTSYQKFEVTLGGIGTGTNQNVCYAITLGTAGDEIAVDECQGEHLSDLAEPYSTTYIPRTQSDATLREDDNVAVYLDEAAKYSDQLTIACSYWPLEPYLDGNAVWDFAQEGNTDGVHPTTFNPIRSHYEVHNWRIDESQFQFQAGVTRASPSTTSGIDPEREPLATPPYPDTDADFIVKRQEWNYFGYSRDRSLPRANVALNGSEAREKLTPAVGTWPLLQDILAIGVQENGGNPLFGFTGQVLVKLQEADAEQIKRFGQGDFRWQIREEVS